MNDQDYQKQLVSLSREALDGLPIGAYVIDKDGTILFFNKVMVQISGVDAATKIEGQNVFEVPTYKKYGLLEFIQRGLEGKPFTIKGIQYVSHVGRRESYRDYYGIPIKNESGQVEKLLCLVEDTTLRRQLEQQVVAEIEDKEDLLKEVREHIDEDMQKIKAVLENTKGFIKTKFEPDNN
jgi:PAS domain S-box-containing protein